MASIRVRDRVRDRVRLRVRVRGGIEVIIYSPLHAPKMIRLSLLEFQRQWSLSGRVRVRVVVWAMVRVRVRV